MTTTATVAPPVNSPTPAPTDTPVPTDTTVPTATPPLPTPTPQPSPAPTFDSAQLQRIPPEITIGNQSRKAVALTFDGGAGSDPTPQILNVLRQRGIHATFFLTARWAQQNPLLVRQIVKDGHEVANHTVTHTDLTTLSLTQATDEITRADQVISGLTGETTTKPWFRFPYGARNDALMRLITQLGYRSVFWTVDSLDWEDQATVGSITSRVLKGAKNGAIVLMHCAGSYTGQALPGILDSLQQSGYSFETVSQIVQ